MSTEYKMDKILKEVCNLSESIEINDDMSPNNVEGWDSLANIQLITELEATFEIEFDFDELLDIENWGSFKAAVKKKIS